MFLLSLYFPTAAKRIRNPQVDINLDETVANLRSVIAKASRRRKLGWPADGVESGDLKNITCPVYWNSDHICIYNHLHIDIHHLHINCILKSQSWWSYYHILPTNWFSNWISHAFQSPPSSCQTAGETCSMWLLTAGRLLLDGELLRDLTSPGSRWWGGGYKVVPSSLAKLVQITPITMVYGIYIYIELLTMVYKPIYNWGAQPCSWAWYLGIQPIIADGLPSGYIRIRDAGRLVIWDGEISGTVTGKVAAIHVITTGMKHGIWLVP